MDILFVAAIPVTSGSLDVQLPQAILNDERTTISKTSKSLTIFFVEEDNDVHKLVARFIAMAPVGHEWEGKAIVYGVSSPLILKGLIRITGVEGKRARDLTAQEITWLSNNGATLWNGVPLPLITYSGQNPRFLAAKEWGL